jgi:two-component system chemotaxis sensor kinase CheA
MDDLLADFLTETNESLAELDVALVRLEQTPDDDATLAQIFRLVHTIKGTCGFLGLPRLERVAHAAENVLGRVRDKLLPVTPEIVSVVLSALDRIKLIVAGLAADGSEPAGEDGELIGALDVASEGRAAPPRLAPPPAADAPAVASVAVPQAEPTPAPPEHAAGEATPEAPLGGQTIRVGVDVLEGLMTLVSELVLTRNQLLQLARVQENAAFTVPLQRLSHITSDLQEGVMKTRMQPIGSAWNKLPRLVRDLSRELGKKIELVMLGADTELDRQVLELIKDPLTHMVRNSADHGLETGAVRRAAGKPETGRVTLNAFHEGGHIIIEIADDGAGLPVEKIRAKALARGLATEAELAAMPDAQILRFIFRAGFSTAAAVTAVSGRGVGMDVVKTNIEKIGGTVDLKSVQGHGTTFTIKIPLTLAIVSALIVEAGGERFAIPQISVVELVRARALQEGDKATDEPTIERINATPVLRLRDRLLPLVSLDALLQLREGVGAAPAESAAHIIVTQVGSNLLGIIVDRVFDTEEIVVKPVAPILRHVSMFSGNTILGDGSVIMILDPNGIARATGVASGNESRAMEQSVAAARDHSDSRTAVLLFRAGGELRAVPLSLVARLEDIGRDKIETSSGKPVTQYRGRLMPLVPMAGDVDPARAQHPVLVFADGERCMGLLVDEIVDVVEDVMSIELAGARPGLLGTAVIAGKATDVVDIGYYLTLAYADWFNSERSLSAKPRVLVVDDNDFFRQMLVSTIGAAGYRVTSAHSAEQALRLRDGGMMFDAIISDIEMPGVDGIAFVQALRVQGPWAELPIVALTAHTDPARVAEGRDAGFTDYVAKVERNAILVSLKQCLAQKPRAAVTAMGAAA